MAERRSRHRLFGGEVNGNTFLGKNDGMNSVEICAGKASIVADGAFASHANTDWFSPEWWQSAGLLRRTAPGRGSAWFVGEPPRKWVLRRYLRGGLIRHISADKYIYTGLQRTRAWREFNLLAELHQAGQPVPNPVAACVKISGLFYTAHLLLEELPAAETLADCLEKASLADGRWQAVGKTIRELHQAGIWHADLNARNILLGEQIYLIDFDRATHKTGSGWQQGNLDRLRRSLDKFNAKPGDFYFSEDDWQALLSGYAAEPPEF